MVAGNIYIVPIKMPSVAESKARLEELDPDNTTGWRDVAKPHHANFTKRVRELEAAQGATEAESDDEGDASDGDMSEEESEDEDFSTPSKLPVDVPPGLQHAHEQLTGIMSKKFAASPASAIEVVAAAGETAKQRAQDSNPAPPVSADEYETHVDTVVANEINNIADDPAHDESMDFDEYDALQKAAIEETPGATRASLAQLQGTSVLNPTLAALATPSSVVSSDASFSSTEQTPEEYRRRNLASALAGTVQAQTPEGQKRARQIVKQDSGATAAAKASLGAFLAGKTAKPRAAETTVKTDPIATVPPASTVRTGVPVPPPLPAFATTRATPEPEVERRVVENLPVSAVGSVATASPEASVPPPRPPPSPTVSAVVRQVRARTSLAHPHTSTAVGSPQQYLTPDKTQAQAMLAQKQVQQITDAVLSTKFRTKRDALSAIDNLENHPLTASLFEKGYLSAENVQDSQYVSAMEKSLRQKQERLGSLKQNPTRTSAPASYMRTMVTPQPGIYAYKRPRFDTAPLYSY
jgi:hypothetical protein